MCGNILDRNLIVKSVCNVSTLYFLNLSLGVLLDKLINMHKASTNSANDLVALFHFDIYSFLAKLIDAFGFS